MRKDHEESRGDEKYVKWNLCTDERNFADVDDVSIDWHVIWVWFDFGRIYSYWMGMVLIFRARLAVKIGNSIKKCLKLMTSMSIKSINLVFKDQLFITIWWKIHHKSYEKKRKSHQQNKFSISLRAESPYYGHRNGRLRVRNGYFL